MGSSKNGTWSKVSNQNWVSVSILLRTVSARNLHSPKRLCCQVSLWENVFWIRASEVMLMRFRRHLTRGGLPFSLPPSLPPSSSSLSPPLFLSLCLLVSLCVFSLPLSLSFSLTYLLLLGREGWLNQLSTFQKGYTQLEFVTKVF